MGSYLMKRISMKCYHNTWTIIILMVARRNIIAVKSIINFATVYPILMLSLKDLGHNNNNMIEKDSNQPTLHLIIAPKLENVLNPS